MIATLFALALSTTPTASVCDAPTSGLRSGPVTLGTRQGDFQHARRACPETEIFAGAGMRGTLELEKYGLDPTIQVASGSPINIVAGGFLSGSVALTRRFEVFANVIVPEVRAVISGYQAFNFGLGDTSVGTTLLVLDKGPFAASVTARATLPTSIGYYQNAFPVGIDAGLTGIFAPAPWFQLHAQTSGTGSLALSIGELLPRAGLYGLMGGELTIFDWVSVVADVDALSFYNSPVDRVAALFALRTRIFAGLGAQIETMVPLVGDDRNLFATRIGLSYQFGSLDLF